MKNRPALGSQLAGFLILAAAILFNLYKCRFGVDLTDEAFYLAPAFKLFSLGDKMFSDEIYNGPRHADLLNYFLVRPFLSFSVYHLRLAAVFFYAAILFGFTYLCFRKRWGFVAGLTFAGCLLFDVFVQPSWSYNWWARNFVLLHHSLIWIAADEKNIRKRSLWFFIAGACLAVAVIAYNPLVIALLVGLLVAGLGSRYLNGRGKVPLGVHSIFLPYLLGAALLLLPDAIYLFSLRSDWLISFQAITHLKHYERDSSFLKLVDLVGYCLTRKEFWICALVLPLLHSLGAKRKLSNLKDKAIFFLWLLSVIYLAGRFFKLGDMQKALSALVGLGLGGAAVMGMGLLSSRDFYLTLLLDVSLAAALTMGMASVNEEWTLSWMMPSLLIPFVALWIHKHQTRWEMASRVLLVGLLAFLTVSSFWDQWNRTYHDVSPKECRTRLNIAPLQGLYTSSRRAFLVEKLESLVQGKKFALAYTSIPGIFLFDGVRSSVDTIFVDLSAPRYVQGRSMRRMLERQRLPELIIHTRNHPWDWGIEVSREVVFKNEAYSQITNCLKGKRVADFPEFEAFTVDSNKLAVQDCAGFALQ